MFPWLQKEVPHAASILFRGNWPATAESFASLAQQGIEVMKEEGANESAIWSLKLRHGQWGEAILVCMRDFPMPPAVLVDFDSDLIGPERDDIKACGTAVSLMMNSSRKHLLRDRKNLLFFMRAVLGEEGVAALDHSSQKFWSRAALEAETSHAADADVQSLFAVHCVGDEEGEAVWLHTHGMDSLGLVDFDIIKPDQFVAQSGSDPVRAIAQAILEGTLAPGKAAEILDGFEFHAVPAAEFVAKADRKWLNFREDHEDHRENRVVICEASSSGLFGFMKKSKGIQPALALSQNLAEGTLIRFSNAATELMSQRAKLTYPFLRQVDAEFAEYGLPVALKIGYTIDGGKPEDREHLWFEAHELRDGEVDATLMNQPFRIARMQEGQRGAHSIENLTDWMIMTPLGPINPRQTLPLRFLRHEIASGRLTPEVLKAARGE